jgi:hypothetical protein
LGVQSTSEVANLIGLYGEVDRIATREGSEGLRAALGNYFTGYAASPNAEGESASALGWFDQFLIATEEQQARRPMAMAPTADLAEADPAIEAIEDITDTLDAIGDALSAPPPLAFTDDVPPEGSPPIRASNLPDIVDALEFFATVEPSPRELSKRFLALTVLMHAIPELRPGGDQAHLVTNALASAQGIVNPDRVDELHVLLRTDFGRMGAWTKFLDTAIERNLVVKDVMLPQLYAPPCVGGTDLKTLPGDKTVVAVELETEFPVAIPFDRAIDYLYPTNWKVNSLWCVMTPFDSTGAPYVEVFDEMVSVACGVPGAWTVTTQLRFTFSRKPADHGIGRQAAAEYNLARPFQPGDDIAVDEGYLKVIEQGDGILLKTKKVVRFNDPSLDGAQMAMLMCPLGYAAGVEQAILDSTKPGSTPDPFPITSTMPGKLPKPPPGTVPTGAVYKTTTATIGSTPGGPAPDPANPAAPGSDTTGDLVGSSIDSCQQYLQEMAADYQDAYAKLAGGTYRIEDYYGDMSRMWGRGLKGWSVMADLTQRALGIKVAPLYGAKSAPSVDPEEP